MKICIAQTKSFKGDISRNLENHLRFVNQAIKLDADFIFFPELSITAYEPELAQELARNADDEIFNPFQDLADKHKICIGVGMPTRSKDGAEISMLIFQSNQKRITYSKQLLHDDELPFFVPGKDQVILEIKNRKIAIGICYESLQPEHFIQAKAAGADIYLASVAKSQNGIEKAYSYFAETARDNQTSILMSNCVGYCDNFRSAGQSAVWNAKGELIEQLDAENEGLLSWTSNPTE